MKKLLVLLMAVALVWAFAAPAAAVDWNFYGSARMATFWESAKDDPDVLASTEDSDLDWSWQNNSRIGATVKGEDVSGRFELGLKADGTSDVDVGTRRLEANWNFGAGTLSVAKGYSSFNQFVSGQVHASDAGLLGQGFMYAGRPGWIGLSFGGFKVQLIDLNTSDLGTGGDIDTTIPKVEASWGMGFDTFSFAIRGGYQTYEIDTGADNFDVDSYGIAGDANFNFGPVRLGVGLAYTTNGGNAGWAAGAGTATLANDDVDDTDTLQGGVVVGFKMSDMVSFEGGFGYRTDSYDTDEDDTDSWEAYVQSVIGMAPGVYIIPEFGYYSEDYDGGEGSAWYLGAKWQIDF